MSSFVILPEVNAQLDSIKKPAIDHHVFIPVTYSSLPFVNSYFSTHTGIGTTSGLVSKIGDLPFKGLSGEVTFVEMGFAYQQRVRKRLAAYVNLTISARVGTEFQSIIAQGFSAITSFDIGWHIKLLEGRKSHMSMIFELQNHQGNFVNVLGFVKDIIEDHPNPSLTESVPVLAGATGLRYAYAISPTLGLKGSANLSYGETYTRGKYGASFKAGTGVDFNFFPRFRVPVGLVLTYDLTSMPDFVYVDGEFSHITQVKVAYTKASDFSLGIEVSFMKYPLLNQKNPVSVITAALAARYYF